MFPTSVNRTNCPTGKVKGYLVTQLKTTGGNCQQSKQWRDGKNLQKLLGQCPNRRGISVDLWFNINGPDMQLQDSNAG